MAPLYRLPFSLVVVYILCIPQSAALSRYEVTKKKGKFDDAINEMAERIARNFCVHGRVQCGIVYCLSRNDCEKVAAELQVKFLALLKK